MPTVEYTKKRSIDSGVLGNDEVLEFNAIDITPFDKIKRNELMTMGKAVSSVLQNIMEGWRVSVKVNYSDIDSWREFLHSVADRESFLFDPTGTEASPGTQYTVTMSTSSVTYPRTKPSYMDITMEFEETS